MKKILALILAAAMVLSLAACAGGNSSGNGTDSGTASGSTDAGSDSGSTDTGSDSGSTDSAADAGSQTQSDDASDGQDGSVLTPVTFVLDWTPNTNHTGVYVAEALGYFEEAGIDLTIVQGPENGAEVVVASGQAQFGVSFQDTMMPSLLGDDAMPITAVAAILQHNTSGIISLAGQGMDRPAGMEGHSYATWDMPIEQAILRQVVEDDGGDFDQVLMIPSTVTDEVTALQTYMVDSIWVYYGWAGIACEVAGLDTDYFAFADISPEFDYYSPVIIGNDDWMAENPELTAAFLEACARGYTYAAEDPDAAADILIGAVPELADSSELVRASQEYLADYYLDDEAPCWGWIDPERWDLFYGWLNENELADETIPAGCGFTNAYLPAEND